MAFRRGFFVVRESGNAGLPLGFTLAGFALANAGASVAALDVDERVVEAANTSDMPLREDGVLELLPRVRRSESIRATTCANAIRDAEALSASSLDCRRSVPRFLPCTGRKSRFPVRDWTLPAYRRFLPAWSLLGRQMPVVAGVR